MPENRNWNEKTGLGMYTVSRAVRENMEKVFVQLAEMGYRGIEFYGEPKDFPVDKVRSALRESGLILTGWHTEWRSLQEDTFADTVQYLQAAGCPAAIIPCLGGKWNVGHDQSEECRDRWLYYTENLNRINERLRQEGIQMGYHNHEHEFVLHYDGKSVFDLLYENLDPSILMEFDSGNCIEGGEDPLEVLRRYRDRRILLHCKPYSRKKGFDVVLGEEEDDNAWQEILHQSGSSFEWILIESENSLLPELENARQCLRGLCRYL